MRIRIPVRQRIVVVSLAAMVLAAAAVTLARAPQVPAAASTSQAAPEYGPARGTLVIVGGNMSNNFGVPQAIVRLAGGPAKKFVIVPTNGGNRNADGSVKVYDEAAVLAPWKQRGLTNVVMLHTWDPKVADTEAFVKPLLDADAVFFDGGRQWNMVDSYMNTRTVKELWRVLERGGVIAGTSAGATIQGDYLVRGDTSGADVMMTKEANHQHGFAFLKRSAIDQHINARNRWDDLIPVMRAYPQYLGLGLSEDTAIVVTGDRFEVIGRWKVTVHDNTHAYQPWQKPYDVLSAGDVYNMQTRKVEKLGNGTTPGRRPDGGAPR